MWTTVYMSQNIDEARLMRTKLEAKQIITMLRSIAPGDIAGESCVEILVPGAELAQALDIIID